MIPLKLELKNFLSYGDTIQTIDFQDHALICLSGKNGNGKSALLDAVTWAIWGQARKVGGIGKADEGLLRLGQTRMMVALSFIVNGKTYRVRREFAKTYGKAHAVLDFEVFDEASDLFRSMTDKTIRATQDVIERTINLDYETFINSAFLRQGQSNEFSKKTAKERKQILANILGLGTYEKLQQHASAEAKKLELQVTTNRQLLELLEAELSQEPTLRVQQELLTKELDVLIKDLTVTQQAVAHHQRLLQQYEEQQKLKLFVETEVQSISQRFTAAATQLRETRNAYHELCFLLRTQPTPAALEERRTVVLAQKKEQTVLNEQLTQLEQQRNKGMQELQASNFALEQEHALAIQQATLAQESLTLTLQQRTKELARLQAERQDLTQKVSLLATALTTGDKMLAQEAAFQASFTATKNQFEKRRTFYQQLVQFGNQGKTEFKELEQKKLLLANEDDAACPLCSQALSSTAHAQVLTDITTREHFLTNRLARIASLLKNLKQLLVTQHETCTALEKQATEYAQMHATLAEKRQQHDDLATKIAILTTEISSLEQSLKMTTAEHLTASTLLTTLTKQTETLAKHPKLTAQAEALSKLEAAITQTQTALTKFVAADAMFAQLETLQAAATNRSSFELKLGSMREKAWELLGILRDLKKQQISYAATLKQLQALDTTELTTLLSALQEKQLSQEHTKAAKTLELGRISSTLERLTMCRAQALEKSTTMKALQGEVDDFEQLANAFGKNGIQALLIEEAMPEIEQEANDLLAKLTDNQSQIFIESLRDLKSGGVKETLEIKVADAAGIRPYEMFSGGEAFRVDFALRIAISKLLARRAGTALQTLIIDEGFGSQDEEGLARIMTALYRIQNDFSKIIIVSHLNEFKDNFPVHFVVEKTTTGSVVHVEERG